MQKRARLSLGILASLVVGTLAAGALSKLPPLTESAALTATGAVPEFQPPPHTNRPEVEAVFIVLRPTGFEPAEITRPAGRVLIAVDNQSSATDITLGLSREGGGQLHATRPSRSTRALRKVLNLQPGTYTLTEAGHPEWFCRINVTR